MLGEPGGDASRAGIVSGSGKPKITEPVFQVAQIAGRILQSLDRIERIDEAAIVRRSRHELGNAPRALAAHRARVEAAFLPDDAGEEFDRQFVLGGILFKRAADIVGGWGAMVVSGAAAGFAAAGGGLCGSGFCGCCGPPCAKPMPSAATTQISSLRKATLTIAMARQRASSTTRKLDNAQARPSDLT